MARSVFSRRARFFVFCSTRKEEMEICSSINGVRELAQKARAGAKRIALVPTMGFLHEGHISLVKGAQKSCGFVALSIFVNPTQFGPSEDFSRYPRDFERDARLCREAGVDVIFAPEAKEIYPEGFSTSVHVEGLTAPLCGASRPGHFDGVCTVVLKLLNIVSPDEAFFGEKDFQQLAVIKRMAKDLNLACEITGMPIVREPDGLAMSSRNAYLSPGERENALSLSRSLLLADEMAAKGAGTGEIEASTASYLAENSIRVDYVSILDPATLQQTNSPRGALMALAGFAGKTRLIDNRILTR